TLAQVESGRGNPDRARGLCEESLAFFEELSDQGGIAMTRWWLGVTENQRGDWSAAAGHFGASVRVIQAMGVTVALPEIAEGLAEVAAHLGDLEGAARLLGSAAAFREMLGIPTLAYSRDLVERRIADLRERLGEAAFAAAWKAGRSLDFQQAAA